MQEFFKCKPTVKTVGLQTERFVQFNENAQPFELIEPIEPFELQLLQLLKPQKHLKPQKPPYPHSARALGVTLKSEKSPARYL